AFNIRRKDKDLHGVHGDGLAIELHDFDSVEEESFYVARRISELRSQGYKMSEVAVLYRANFQSRLIEEAFVHRGLPYVVVGAVAFYERKEVKDILSYLRLIANVHDDYGALRIVNTPSRRIGASSVKKLNDW